MSYKVGLPVALLALSITIAFNSQDAYAPTKIVPTDGAKPGNPFTIIDTPEGRLVDGSVALFKPSGSETIIPLRTHSPYKTAQGTLPADIIPGDYTVSVRKPDGEVFGVGTFIVIPP